MLDLQSYLRGKGRNVPLKKGRLDLTSYMLGKAASGGIQEITGVLPLTVRSRASQILKNYIIYGTALGAGVETEQLFNIDEISEISVGISSRNGIEYTDIGYYTITAFGTLSGYCYVRVLNGDNIVSTAYLITPNQLSPVKINLSIGQRFAIYNANPDNVETTISLFNQWKPVILYSNASQPEYPDHYIPHGYKLPITVTSNGTTTDYPVYIGDSQLGEEEYVDYESGKVWKRTEQLITFGEKEFALASKHAIWSALGNAVRIVTDGANPAISGTLQAYKNNLRFTLSAGTYSYRLIRSESGHSLRIRYVSDNTIVQDTTSGTFTIAEETDFYFSIYINAEVVLDTVDYMVIVEGEEIPATIIPYLQPTDPPIPLPDLAIPQGEVTIDIDGELKPQATVKGKIEQI